MMRAELVSIVSALLLVNRDGMYDAAAIAEEAALLLRAAEENELPTLADAFRDARIILAETRGNLDAATRRWAQLVYVNQRQNGDTRGDAFTKAFAEVNTFRHACGLDMFTEADARL